MNRERFEQLLEAYGADSARWPAADRAAAAEFAARHAGELAGALDDARALDAALATTRGGAIETSALAAKVLAGAPRRRTPFDRRAVWALAACAVFGVAIGYGGGLLAPPADTDEGYFAMAFEAPVFGEEG